ncbi:hypothetical protein HDU67_002916, partial [Dinochytrium kinnereticum]
LPVASILLYSRAAGGLLDPSIIFPALIYFGQLLDPLQGLPQSLSMIVNGHVALTRIQKFLVAEERETRKEDVSDVNKDGENAIEIVGATLKWEAAIDEEAEKKDGKNDVKKEKKKGKKEEPEEVSDEAKQSQNVEIIEEEAVEKKDTKDDEPLFKDLNLNIKKGKLTAVVGVVGSGKSSLLSAILGEMTPLSGTTTVKGRIALCQQQPWLLSQTIQENILFGQPIDDERLEQALRVCGLKTDLTQFSQGIHTEIGEKGIILSGGQKARVALARAVYDRADVYLLDDPLAALDSHVGKSVFEECIFGSLGGRTRVLVTHQLHVLDKVDWVIVMRDGKVAEEGTFVELMEKEGDDAVLKDLMKDYKTTKDIDPDQKSTTNSTDTDETKAIAPPTSSDSNDSNKSASTSAPNLIAEEDRERGSLKFSVVREYWTLAGGLPIILMLSIAVLFMVVSTTLRDLWLAWWTDGKFGWTSSQYFTGYAVIGVINVSTM